MTDGAEDFATDRGIDPEPLRRAFAETGIVQIRPFLAGDGAERLRRHLAGRDDWSRLVQTAAGGTFEHARAGDRFSAAQLKALERLAATAQGPGFSYAYDRIVPVDPRGEKRETATPLARFAEFLARPATRDLLGSICGAEDIDSVEAQATRYGPGHFLTTHLDSEEGSRRRVAYVLGLTGGWRPEWGGLLQFHEPDGEVARGLVPRMNALTLFKVPRAHSVSLVAPAAAAPRYSIAGWLNGPPL
jgi:SM-20-related protein